MNGSYYISAVQPLEGSKSDTKRERGQRARADIFDCSSSMERQNFTKIFDEACERVKREQR